MLNSLFYVIEKHKIHSFFSSSSSSRTTSCYVCQPLAAPFCVETAAFYSVSYISAYSFVMGEVI
jgi:hypothetical protein